MSQCDNACIDRLYFNDARDRQCGSRVETFYLAFKHIRSLDGPIQHIWAFNIDAEDGLPGNFCPALDSLGGLTQLLKRIL